MLIVQDLTTSEQVPHLKRNNELLLGEALLDGAVQLPHQALARPHVQHQVDVAHIDPLQCLHTLHERITTIDCHYTLSMMSMTAII